MNNIITEHQYRLSRRLAQLEPSATAGMSGKIAQMKSQGINVISFSIGEPDFNTPELIKAAAVTALEHNYTHYTPTGGVADLRRAVAQRASSNNGVPYTINNVTVTSGAKEALYLAFQAICDSGDEVIVPAPYWVSYIEQVRLSGATPVIVPTTEATGFKLTAEQLAAHITPNTRMLILNSPSNPTGAVYNADELRALAKVLCNTDILVISDEIYDSICYVDYARWLRVAPEFTDRTLVVNGASKSYAMTGWRVGYIAGPEPFLEAIKTIQSHSTTHPSSIAQYAALAAFSPSAEIEQAVVTMAAAFRERRDLMIANLKQIPNITYTMPEGAFYVFPNIKGFLNRPLANGATCATSQELTNYLLDYAHIGVIAGESFGAPDHIRLSYAAGNADIIEGMRRLRAAL